MAVTSVRGTSYSSAGSTTHGQLQRARSCCKLGPQEYNTKRAAGAWWWCCPTKQVTFDLGAPAAGPKQFYSGHRTTAHVAMSRQVTVPPGGGTLTLEDPLRHRTGLRRRPGRRRRHPGSRNRQRRTPTTASRQPERLGTSAGRARTAPMWTGPSRCRRVPTTVSIEYLTDAAVAGNDGVPARRRLRRRGRSRRHRAQRGRLDARRLLARRRPGGRGLRRTSTSPGRGPTSRTTST